MSFEFNADEVFAVAEDIERNGAVFYRDAARKTKSIAAKEFLEGLAAMEDGPPQDVRGHAGRADQTRERRVHDLRPERRSRALPRRPGRYARLLLRRGIRDRFARGDLQGRRPGRKGLHRLLPRDERGCLRPGGQGQARGRRPGGDAAYPHFERAARCVKKIAARAVHLLQAFRDPRMPPVRKSPAPMTNQRLYQKPLLCTS